VFDFVDDPSLFEGMTYVTAFAGEDEFLKRYKEYSGLENTFGSTFIYDMINMTVMAFENKAEEESAAQALESLRVYDGANGKVFQEGNYFKAKSILRKIENKKYIVVEE
jgi:ABC-type branched-subunit amino acid transport system substrate-binding protein